MTSFKLMMDGRDNAYKGFAGNSEGMTAFRRLIFLRNFTETKLYFNNDVT
jgi:hypothetical protein